jgi:hypothetical protein
MGLGTASYPDIGWLELGCKCCPCCVPCDGRVRVNFKMGLAATVVTCGEDTYDHIALPAGNSIVLEVDESAVSTWSCGDTSSFTSVDPFTGFTSETTLTYQASICCPSVHSGSCLGRCPIFRYNATLTVTQTIPPGPTTTITTCLGPIAMSIPGGCRKCNPEDPAGFHFWYAQIDDGEIANDQANCNCSCYWLPSLGTIITANCFCTGPCPRTGITTGSLSCNLHTTSIFGDNDYPFSMDFYEVGSAPPLFDLPNQPACGGYWAGTITLETGCIMVFYFLCQEDVPLGVVDLINVVVGFDNVTCPGQGLSNYVQTEAGCNPFHYVAEFDIVGYHCTLTIDGS